MDFKGQGAVEYLLILGAAVILAVVVIVTLTSLSATTQTQVSAAQNVDMPNICSSDKCYVLADGVCTEYDTGQDAGTAGNPPTIDSKGYCVCTGGSTIGQESNGSYICNS